MSWKVFSELDAIYLIFELIYISRGCYFPNARHTKVQVNSSIAQIINGQPKAIELMNNENGNKKV